MRNLRRKEGKIPVNGKPHFPEPFQPCFPLRYLDNDVIHRCYKVYGKTQKRRSVVKQGCLSLRANTKQEYALIAN